MNKEDYISSGLLELYVAGALSEKENQEVYEAILKFPEVLKEVLEIESAMVKLMASVGAKPSVHGLSEIKAKLNLKGSEAEIVSINKGRSTWISYTGWAAAIIIAGSFIWKMNSYSKLEQLVAIEKVKKTDLENKLENNSKKLSEADEFIDAVRNKNITQISLGGQSVSPNSYAQVYWDKTNDQLYLDAAGLPEPPEGKVYQLWSLTLDPLTPTDMGVIEQFASDENKIFKIDNPYPSEAFGITLEPAGGSKSPTMDQLYVLGVISS